jgi:uncharacterized protein
LSSGLDLFSQQKGSAFMIARLSMRRARKRLMSARYVLAALAVLACIGIAKPALAQTPGAPPTPAAILLAKQIVQIKGVDKLLEPLIRGVVEKVKDQFMQTNFMWAADINAVAAQLEKEYAPRESELIDETARIYASHFNEGELRQILTFYQSPLGRKMINEEPKALDESMANAGNFGDRLSEEVIDKFRAEMKKRGHDL